MAKGDYLGDLEQLLLTAVLLLGEQSAYGMTVHDKVKELAEGHREVSLGSVYTTLERLETKGFVTSKFSDPTPERGGRAKKYFRISASGELALRNSLKVAGNMVRELAFGGVV